MELIKNHLRQLSVKSEAVSQVTFDEDWNVPDVKPDVGRMIQKKGEVEVAEVQMGEGRARVLGSLCFSLLYVSEGEEKRVCSLEGKLPIDENLNLEGLSGGDKICLKWEIEDLSIHLIHSRKLNVKAIVTFQAAVEELRDVEIPADLKEPGEISMKKKEIRVLELGVHKKDTLRVKKEMAVASNKPDIHEILWKDMEIRGLDIRSGEGKVEIRGELFLFVLYAGADPETPPQWLEQAIPFSGEAECGDCTSDMIPNVEVTMVQNTMEIAPDADGEERMLQMDVVLELDLKLYRETSMTLLQDVYTPKMKTVPVSQPEELESLLVKNYSKCRISDKLKVEESPHKILQICHGEGKIKVDEARVVENGILAEGVLELRILYIISDDEMPFYAVETAVPFSHVVEAPGITRDCRYHLRTDLEQLSTTMIDSNEIEIKAVVNLNAVVLKCRQEEIIREIREEELDMEELQNMPGIVRYLVQPGDTLWDIAKQFYTTSEEIRQLNHLTSDEINPMDSLLLVKKVE